MPKALLKALHFIFLHGRIFDLGLDTNRAGCKSDKIWTYCDEQQTED